MMQQVGTGAAATVAEVAAMGDKRAVVEVARGGSAAVAVVGGESAEEPLYLSDDCHGTAPLCLSDDGHGTAEGSELPLRNLS